MQVMQGHPALWAQSVNINLVHSPGEAKVQKAK